MGRTNWRLDWGSRLSQLTLLTLLTFLGAYTFLLVWTSLVPSFSIFQTAEDQAQFSRRDRLMRTNWTGGGSARKRIGIDCKVKVALILCDDGGKKLRETSAVGKDGGKSKPGVEFERQINQTLVLIKSILVTMEKSTDCVKIILISDERKHFEKIKREILRGESESWDERFTSRLRLGFVPLKYPPGTAWMRRLFRPCATLRLFLPELLPYDAVLYLDTDIIFLRSLDALWSEFRQFNTTTTVAGMSPCLFHYGSPRNSIPFYGSSGLNAGIMLMNLTRMRNTQWTHKIRMVGTQYRSQIKLADQDILNIYFHTFPRELHLLSCDWNFRPFQCHNGSLCQAETMADGISGLHGNALSFTPTGPEPLFYSIFKTFQETKLSPTFGLNKLVDDLKLGLQRGKVRGSSPCGKFPGFDVAALTRLMKTAEIPS